MMKNNQIIEQKHTKKQVFHYITLFNTHLLADAILNVTHDSSLPDKSSDRCAKSILRTTANRKRVTAA